MLKSLKSGPYAARWLQAPPSLPGTGVVAPSRQEVHYIWRSTAAKIRLANQIIRQQIWRSVTQHYFACLQHITTIRHIQGHIRVLLHQKDCHALLANLLNNVEDALHQNG